MSRMFLLTVAALPIAFGVAHPAHDACHQPDSTEVDECSTGQTVHLLQKSVQHTLPIDLLDAEIQTAEAALQMQPELSCRTVEGILVAHQSPGEYTPFGVPKLQVEVLRKGVADVAAQGLLRALALERDQSTYPPAGAPCFQAIGLLGVQYDQDRSLVLSQHAPHLWDAVVAWNKRVIHDHELLRAAVVMFAGVYGKPPSDEMLLDMDRAGGFDFMLGVLKYNNSDLIVAQAAWAGLSDNVENRRVGAELVADKGGVGQGLAFLIGRLRSYRGKSAYQPGQNFGLRYESVHVINGILMHDDISNTWKEVAVRNGFMEEAILAMVEEPNDELTQENGCEAIALMGNYSAQNRARLRELDAIKRATEALDRFKSHPVGSYYILNSCSAALLNFAEGDVAAQDQMLQLGLLDAVRTAYNIWVWVPPRAEPWQTHFPWSDVEALKLLLENRNVAVASSQN